MYSQRGAEGFQFYDSPIKSKTASVAAAPFTGFNSMIVRLKVPSRRLRCSFAPCFNSMIVRLKGVCRA